MAKSTGREPDPPAQLRALASALAPGAAFPRGFVIRGEERYFREAALAQISAAAQARGWELCRHDAQDPDFDLHLLLDDLSSLPLFSTARCVLVRKSQALLKKESDRDAALTRAAISFLDAGASEGCIVLEAQSLRADHAVCKAVARSGGILFSSRRLYDAPPPWDPDPRKAEIVVWLSARARQLDVPLDADQAAYVAAAIGNDLFALESALERLRQRGAHSVRDSIGWTSAVSAFQLAEDICRGASARALPAIEALFRYGLAQRDGSREVDLGAVLAIFLGSLRGKLRQSAAAAARVPAGEQSPQARAELEARLRSRPPAQWGAMLADFALLERLNRTGASVDANDLMLFALRWRIEARRPAASR